MNEPSRKKATSSAKTRSPSGRAKVAARAAEPRPRHRAATERDLVDAVRVVLVEEGAKALTPSAVAQRAAVDKALIYRYYGSFEGLIREFTRSEMYWPTPEEIVPDPEALLALPFRERFVLIMLRYARALRARPDTLAILAAELAERGEFQSALETRREVFGRALFEFGHDAPPDYDVAAAATLLTGAIHYLLIRSRQVSIFNGIPIGTDTGWERLEAMIARMIAI